MFINLQHYLKQLSNIQSYYYNEANINSILKILDKNEQYFTNLLKTTSNEEIKKKLEQIQYIKQSISKLQQNIELAQKENNQEQLQQLKSKKQAIEQLSNIDWQNKNLNYELIIRKIDKILSGNTRSQEKKNIRKGKLKGEGIDHITILSNNKYEIIVPLTHTASCTLGRDTKWCTAMENDPKYWKNYIFNKNVVLFYIYELATNKKYALITYPNDTYEIYNKNDEEITETTIAQKLLYEIKIPLSTFFEKAKEIRKKYFSTLIDFLQKNNNIPNIKNFLQNNKNYKISVNDIIFAIQYCDDYYDIVKFLLEYKNEEFFKNCTNNQFNIICNHIEKLSDKEAYKLYDLIISQKSFLEQFHFDIIHNSIYRSFINKYGFIKFVYYLITSNKAKQIKNFDISKLFNTIIKVYKYIDEDIRYDLLQTFINLHINNINVDTILEIFVTTPNIDKNIYNELILTLLQNDTIKQQFRTNEITEKFLKHIKYINEDVFSIIIEEIYSNDITIHNNIIINTVIMTNNIYLFKILLKYIKDKKTIIDALTFAIQKYKTKIVKFIIDNVNIDIGNSEIINALLTMVKNYRDDRILNTDINTILVDILNYNTSAKLAKYTKQIIEILKQLIKTENTHGFSIVAKFIKNNNIIIPKNIIKEFQQLALLSQNKYVIQLLNNYITQYFL